MQKTIYEAATHARENVRMVKVAPKQYQIEEYSEVRRAWRASWAMDYRKALAELTVARHALALIWRGWDWIDAYQESEWENRRGRLEDRIKRSLRYKLQTGVEK